MKLSKTAIFNLLTIAAGVGTYLLNSDLITQNPDAVAIVGLAVSGINLVLRYFTNSPMAGLFHKAK